MVAGGLGGAGNAMAQIGADQMHQIDQQQMAQYQSDLAEQKAEALARFNQGMAQQQRQTQADAIQTGSQGIIAGQMLGKLNNDYTIDDTDGDGNPISRPVTQADVDNGTFSPDELAPYLPNDKERAIAAVQAAVNAGYESPDKLASIMNSSDIAAMKWETVSKDAQLRADTMKQIADAKDQTSAAIAAMRADLAKTGSGSGTPGAVYGHELNALDNLQKAKSEELARLITTYPALSPEEKQAATARETALRAQIDAIQGQVQDRLKAGLPDPNGPNGKAAVLDGSNTGTGQMGFVGNPMSMAMQLAGLPADDQAGAVAQFNRQTQASPLRLTSPTQYAAIPSGIRFIAPDGSIRIKP
jgi:hypothetical protein